MSKMCCSRSRLQNSEPACPGILQHLEQLAADLACSEAAASQGNDSSFEGTRQGARIDNQVPSSHDHVLKIGAFSFGNRMTSGLLGMHNKFQYQAKLFYPSERPPYKIPVRGIYYDIQPRTAGRAYAARFSDFNAQKVPVQVAKRLFENYRDSILPRFPCFSEEELTEHFDYMYGQGPTEHPPSELSYFIVPIILAISSLTSSSHDFAKVAALSESLHLDAMQHKAVLRDSSIPNLQCLLLLIQLALILPYTANLWYLTGEAMRIAVSLGLHHELDPAYISEETSAELRKRLFWVIYQVDRIVGVSGACPLALSDRHITVKLPYGGGNPFCSKSARFRVDGSNSYRENLFLIHTKMRIVQSEIHGVQFFDQPLPNGMLDYDEWVQKTQELIQKLIDQVTVDGIAPSWLVFAGHQCQVLLFRPCSRRIVVSNDSMLAAVRACIQLIKSDMVSLERGGFAMTFELVNSAFHAGMVLLYALRSHATGLEQASLAATARETLDVLIQLLKMHGKRWPAILDTSHYIQDSMDTCLRDTSGQTGSVYDMSIVEELDYLITQRRVHSVFHRNIPFIPPHHPGPYSDTPSQSSEDFINDENWWSAFINDDQVMDGMDLMLPVTNRDTSPLPRSTRPAMLPSPQESTTTHTGSLAELDGIMEALPACSFCRDRRIKCSRQLPACAACLRSSRECLIYDPILEHNVSCNRISLLADHIKSLAVIRGSTYQPSSTPSTPNNAVLLPLPCANAVLPSITVLDTNIPSLFFGPYSSFERLRTCLANRKVAYKLPHSLEQAIKWSIHTSQSAIPIEDGFPSASVTNELFDLYARSAHLFFPVLETKMLSHLASTCDGSYEEAPKNSHEFCYLILAIASLIGKRNEPLLAVQAYAWFQKAICEMTLDCDHSSLPENIFMLQRTLLICVFLLLSPGSGDIWRHLGFAIRLFLDLSHGSLTEDDGSRRTFRMISRTLYCLESQVSLAFGRPSLLIIGDDLRQELMMEETGSLEEHISICSYLISFKKLQIYDAVLSSDRDSEHTSSTQSRTAFEYQDHQNSLDRWYSRWEELVASNLDHENRHQLQCWGQFHYYHGTFLVSLLGAAYAGKYSPSCQHMTDAALELALYNQLFARRMALQPEHRSPILIPMDWTNSHFVLQAGYSALAEIIDANVDNKSDSSLEQWLSLVSLLEADPEKLLTGHGLVFKDLYEGQGCVSEL
ncbi:putative Fungal-specific transcription factor domain-containing protein [Seiridium cardinale]